VTPAPWLSTPFFASPIPARSPMGAYRGLAAKCPANGSRESPVSFRERVGPQRPPVDRANPSPVFGPMWLAGYLPALNYANQPTLPWSWLAPPVLRALYPAARCALPRLRPLTISRSSAILRADEPEGRRR